MRESDYDIVKRLRKTRDPLQREAAREIVSLRKLLELFERAAREDKAARERLLLETLKKHDELTKRFAR